MVIRIALVLALTGAAASSEPVFQRDQVDIGQDKKLSHVTINNPYGSVTIQGTKNKQVSIQSDKIAPTSGVLGKLRVAANLVGKGLEIHSVIKGGPEAISAADGSTSVNLRISVPVDTKVSVTTWNGSVTVRDVEAGASVVVNRGNVHLERVLGEVRSRANNGNSTIKDVFGNVSSKTLIGDLELERISGNQVDGFVHRGDIVGHRVVTTRGSFVVHTGNVRIEASAAAGGDIVARSQSGNVTVKVIKRSAIHALAKGKTSLLPQTMETKTRKDGSRLGRSIGEGKPATIAAYAPKGSASIVMSLAVVPLTPLSP